MNKKEIKNLLISLRNEENSPIVNNLLGKIDLMDDATIEAAAIKVGNTEETIRTFFINRINIELEKQEHIVDDKKYPLNKMFTYGINGNCVHLHLPGKLDETMAQLGRDKTLALVNRHLIDALERIKSMKESNHSQLNQVDSIFMISPALIRGELSFLQDLDFDTKYFNRKDLTNEELLNQDNTAKLALTIFGKERNVGCATLPLEKMNTQEWQDKKNQKINELEQKGVSLDDKKHDIDEKE